MYPFCLNWRLLRCFKTTVPPSSSKSTFGLAAQLSSGWFSPSLSAAVNGIHSDSQVRHGSAAPGFSSEFGFSKFLRGLLGTTASFIQGIPQPTKRCMGVLFWFCACNVMGLT